MDSFVCNAIGTLTAEIITLPICTIKTVYQNQQQHSARESIRWIYETYGWRGFISASKPALLSQVVSTSSKYGLYQMMKPENPDRMIERMMVGAFSGIIGSFFHHPIDVWKVHVQQGKIWEWRKWNTWYSGYMGTISKNIVLYSCLFPFYDFYEEHLPEGWGWMKAPCTTMTVSLFVQPFDYYRVVRMSGGKPDWRKSYRGYGWMVGRAIPHFAITMWMTEQLKKVYHRNRDGEKKLEK